ncbi:hypothetical protein AUK40_02155 [Candidatus Wirthbacteria bacterium CG2_30_54_11]|uniref:Uncharacterized protein n=1 Tax=Candidatus Wirthbacteria bacterium CG2_30_54_11 TaxID=1817892 RepID=A0A1J5J3C2_9BACT|nr:MAG: hypothetical protein AUK40_02155 [Candidatus Wirthbacteria bacterium CG2_30_54_11]
MKEEGHEYPDECSIEVEIRFGTEFIGTDGRKRVITEPCLDTGCIAALSIQDDTLGKEKLGFGGGESDALIGTLTGKVWTAEQIVAAFTRGVAQCEPSDLPDFATTLYHEEARGAHRRIRLPKP